MLKVCSKGKLNLDYILSEDDGTSAKARRVFRDYKNVTKTFGGDALIFGGWAMQLLCPGTTRKHHDLDLFLLDHSYTSKDIEDFRNKGYKRISATGFCNPNGDVIDLFGRESSRSFVLTTIIDPNTLFADSITLTLKEEDMSIEQKRVPYPPSRYTLDDFGEAMQRGASAKPENEMPLSTMPAEVMYVKVPSPIIQILLKARSYASRKEEQDSIDMISLVKTHYSGDLCRLFKTESAMINVANERFSQWLRDFARFEDASLLFNMTEGSRSKKVKKIVDLYKSYCWDELRSTKDMSAAIISAYHSLHPGDVGKLL